MGEEEGGGVRRQINEQISHVITSVQQIPTNTKVKGIRLTQCEYVTEWDEWP